jgi:hypothetical protein
MTIWKMLCNGREVSIFENEQDAQKALKQRYEEVQRNVHKLPEELSSHHFKFIYGWEEKQLNYKIVSVETEN